MNKLKWHSLPLADGDLYTEVATDGETIYAVQLLRTAGPQGGYWRAHALNNKGKSYHLVSSATSDRIKAFCEHHAATGQWE